MSRPLLDLGTGGFHVDPDAVAAVAVVRDQLARGWTPAIILAGNSVPAAIGEPLRDVNNAITAANRLAESINAARTAYNDEPPA